MSSASTGDLAHLLGAASPLPLERVNSEVNGVPLKVAIPKIEQENPGGDLETRQIRMPPTDRTKGCLTPENFENVAGCVSRHTDLPEHAPRMPPPDACKQQGASSRRAAQQQGASSRRAARWHGPSRHALSRPPQFGAGHLAAVPPQLAQKDALPTWRKLSNGRRGFDITATSGRKSLAPK